MHWILTRLRDSRAPLWRYVLRAYAIQSLPVVALGALLVILSGGAAVSGARGGGGGLGAFLGFVVFAPLVENLLMAGGLWLAARFVHTDVARAVAVARARAAATARAARSSRREHLDRPPSHVHTTTSGSVGCASSPI